MLVIQLIIQLFLVYLYYKRGKKEGKKPVGVKASRYNLNARSISTRDKQLSKPNRVKATTQKELKFKLKKEMENQILESCKQHLSTLKYLKELTFKYDETDQELTTKEWETIKQFEIDKRKWSWYFENVMTANEYWDSQIKSTTNLLATLTK